MHLTRLQNDFMTLIKDVQRNEGLHPHEVMRNFIDMAYYANSNAVWQFLKSKEDHVEKQEAEYMAIVERHRKPESVPLYAQMMAQVTEALEHEYEDFLGPLFMECMANKYQGQFFTPHALCKLMAEVTFKDMVDTWDQRYTLTVHEPAAGAGAMCLAMAGVARDAGLNINKDIYFECVDVSPSAMRTCYVQLNLAGLNATVIQSNTLGQEYLAGDWGDDWAPTLMRAMYPERKKPKGRVRTRPKKARVRSRKNLNRGAKDG